MELKHILPLGLAWVLVKLENVNPTGNMEDRVKKLGLKYKQLITWPEDGSELKLFATAGRY